MRRGRKNRVRCVEGKKQRGAQGRNRTTDTGIFSPLLYRLSYLGVRRPPLRGDRREGAQE